MSGYFSRLIEQSGIPVGPAAGPVSALPTRPPAPIDLEAPAEPQGEEPIFETRKDPETAFEVPGRIVEELVHDPVERVLYREAPESPLRRPQDRRRSETSKGGAPDPRVSERISPRHTGDAGDLPEKVDAVEAHKGADHPVDSSREVLEQDETVEGATYQADERSASDIGASGEAPAFDLGEKPRERVWRSTFEEVRGWVAESQVVDDGRAQQDVSWAVTSVAAPFVEGRGATARPGSVVTSPREEPETRDLRLEIGTISVTVEEPRGEVPERNQRAEGPERKPAGSGERSRLSRHYVRVR